MNLPLKLTLFRLLVTPFFVLLLFVEFPGHYTLALLLFLIAMATDYLDGWLARSRSEVTDVGVLLDPLADKILITSAFISFVGLEAIKLPAWMVIIIVSREFAITGLRLVAAGKGKILPAGRWGKHKTLSQVTAVSVILIYLCLRDYAPEQIERYYSAVISLVGVTVLLTLSSGIYYLVQNLKIFVSRRKKD